LQLSEPFNLVKPNEYGKRVAKQASTGGGRWESLLTSYPPNGLEVFE